MIMTRPLRPARVSSFLHRFVLPLAVAAVHWRWFLVKRAKAVAPMVCAFSGAFSTPPDALTCAPKYFMTNV